MLLPVRLQHLLYDPADEIHMSADAGCGRPGPAVEIRLTLRHAHGRCSWKYTSYIILNRSPPVHIACCDTCSHVRQELLTQVLRRSVVRAHASCIASASRDSDATHSTIYTSRSQSANSGSGSACQPDDTVSARSLGLTALLPHPPDMCAIRTGVFNTCHH